MPTLAKIRIRSSITIFPLPSLSIIWNSIAARVAAIPIREPSLFLFTFCRARLRMTTPATPTWSAGASVQRW